MPDARGDLSIGERIQMHRRRRGLSQDEAAGLAGVSVSLWRKWEQGTRAVGRMSQLISIAKALRVTDLREITGAPVTAGPNGRPRHEAVETVRLALLRHPTLLPAVSALPVTELARRVTAAWDAAQTASPWRYAHTGAVLPDLIAQAEQAIRVYSGPDLDRAIVTAGEVYLLVRAWLKWVGEYDLALVAAERSLTVAERGANSALLGAAAWNLAQAVSTRGETTETRVVVEDTLQMLAADAASEFAPPELVSAWGALHLIGMVGAVREDDQRDGRRLLAGAAQAAARLGGDRNDWRMAFGATNVAIHRVAYSVELGQSRTAVSGARAVAVERSPSVERRVSHRLDVAQSHTRLREDVPALQALLAAEAESPEQVYYSVTTRAMLREMLRRESTDSRPLLRPLADRVGVLT